MKFIDYLKDHIFVISLFLITIILIFCLCLLFSVPLLLSISILIILFFSFSVSIIYEFLKKRSFYNNISKSLDSLDKKYYITEIINKPNFFEGDFLVDYIYTINKSFIEEINKYKYSSKEFKEYIELWCHEIKTPIATSNLIIENNKNNITNNILEEIDKINYLVEQVLFYARSDEVYKDYIITKVNLIEVIEKVIKRNKKLILSKNIKLDLFNDIKYVNSDSKWLEFIINQIISNSIKYSKENNGYIKFSIDNNKDNTILLIEDNGIGIKNDELSRVFDKGFTGTNGRKKYNSTGMGLYLVKKLCSKLDHNIIINSNINKGTVVIIIFPNNSLVSDIK